MSTAYSVDKLHDDDDDDDDANFVAISQEKTQTQYTGWANSCNENGLLPVGAIATSTNLHLARSTRTLSVRSRYVLLSVE